MRFKEIPNYEGIYKISRDGRVFYKNKGLVARGEKHGSSKLTWGKVRKIRRLHNSGRPQKELAAFFNVHNVTIWNIVHGKHWKEKIGL